MRRKGILTSFLTVFLVVAFAGMAFAAQNIFKKTTVPDIPKSECWQVGTLTWEADNNTVLTNGDVMRNSLSNNATLCKSFNYFLRLHDGTAAPIIGGAATPVTSTEPAFDSIVAPAAATSEYGLLVVGVAGQQTYTMTVAERDNVTGIVHTNIAFTMTFVGRNAANRLIVKFFDGKNAAPYFWKRNTTGAYLWNSATAAPNTFVAGDNILCANTSSALFTLEYLESTSNSVPAATGLPVVFSGDDRIAHITAAAQLSLVTCKGAACGHIVLGTGLQGSTCNSFDYDTNGTGANGYCLDHTADATLGALNVPKFIIQSTQAFEVTNYSVTAQILVNGSAAERGVYWSGTAPAYKSSATTTCNTAPGGLALGALGYLRGDAITAVPGAALIAAGANNCAAVPAASRAVSFTSAPAVLFGAGEFFFELNLPPFVYNLAEVNANDLVTVRVTLTKGTCGSWSFDLCMGTFGCPLPAAVGSGRLCPFVPSLSAADPYVTGIAVTNTSATATTTVLLTATKANGTTATFTTPALAPGAIYQADVSAIAWLPAGVQPAGVPKNHE